VIAHEYHRELQVAIKAIKPTTSAVRRDGEATTAATMSTPNVMPALVQSAFDRFPGRERRGATGGAEARKG
jgi:hypothetical protein